jgi:hypothetical protein
VFENEEGEIELRKTTRRISEKKCRRISEKRIIMGGGGGWERKHHFVRFSDFAGVSF